MKLFARESVDERQRQELVCVGNNAFWLLYYFLIASVVAQCIFFKPDIIRLSAEFAGIFVGSTAIAIGCVRRGLWDFGTKMTLRNYLLVSVLAGILVIVILALILRNRALLPLVYLAIGACTFFACLFLLLLFSRLVLHRRKQLEAEVEDKG